VFPWWGARRARHCDTAPGKGHPSIPEIGPHRLRQGRSYDRVPRVEAPRAAEEKETDVFRKRSISLTLVVASLLFGGLPSFGAGQSSDEFFQRLITGEVSGPILAGPFESPLEQQPGVLVVYKAGIDVSDFVVHAAFTNPVEDDGTQWDFGFQFRTSGNDEDLRVFVVSDGTWNFSVGTNPPEVSSVATNFDPAPGAVNTLDMLVEGSRALFGINGQFEGELALPEVPASGDVYASTGFFGDLTVPGRILGLTDFRVSALPVTDPTEQDQDAAPVSQDSPPRPVTLHAGSCANLGDVVEPLLDATFPLGEFEGQASAIVSETSFTRVPMLVDELLEAPHAINVSESSEAPNQSIACGDIGGVRDEIGAYVIALTERNQSGYRGIAYVAPENELSRTNISVFIVPGTAAPENPLPIIEEPTSGATPESVIRVEGVPVGTPET
jgi:hypothetical protein